MKIGIAGAGIMGRLLAFALVKEGHQVDLFEKNDQHDQFGCSMVAAGLLTPVAELEKSGMILFRMGNDALRKHWPRILDQLDEDLYFQQSGSILVAHPRDKADLEHYIERIKFRLKGSDFGRQSQKLNREELAGLEPQITKFTEAYYLSGEGQLDNQSLLASLGKYLDKAVTWHLKTTVTQVKPMSLQVNEQEFKFDLVFDCRGMGAQSIFTHLQGIRGELIWLHAPEVKIQRPIRFIHPRYGLYIVPRPESIYLIGASEIQAEDYSPISVKTTLELLTAAYYLHSGFAEARILKTLTQCRPTLASGLPCIKYEEGFIALNGLYRHGFLIAPTLVNEVMRFLQSGFSSLNYPEIWEKYYD